ncbi:hypothetical protein [Amycolatopsis thermoflava]|uniref:hypothetical protein n=1 Tax=Amycolatopsis thermoflava TaxID=84480 RepID=UPI000409DE4E|nr:hypothetical protein [Amycolatopsis thermoflava]
MPTPQPPTPPQQPITRVDLFRRMPQGGTTYLKAKQDPRCPACNVEHLPYEPGDLCWLGRYQREGSAIVDTATPEQVDLMRTRAELRAERDELRAQVERHNTELRQQIARGVAAELERIRREIHDEGALATYTAMDVELRLDAAAAEIRARLSGEDRS